jgi:Mn-dependent DtxR family transcriptional regulator
MSDDEDAVEAKILDELSDSDGLTPAALAMATGVDLSTVLDVVVDLRADDLVVREGFDTCQLTARGREVVDERPESH